MSHTANSISFNIAREKSKANDSGVPEREQRMKFVSSAFVKRIGISYFDAPPGIIHTKRKYMYAIAFISFIRAHIET